MPTRTAGASFTIGVLSRRARVNIETIRYYERVGLMPDPPRTEGGHRLYGRDQLKRLVFVRRGRELGFTLKDVRALLALVDGGDYTCAEVKALTDAHRREVGEKIADLRRLEATLAEISAQCDGGTIPDCPVIDALFAPTGQSPETG